MAIPENLAARLRRQYGIEALAVFACAAYVAIVFYNDLRSLATAGYVAYCGKFCAHPIFLRYDETPWAVAGFLAIHLAVLFSVLGLLAAPVYHWIRLLQAARAWPIRPSWRWTIPRCFAIPALCLVAAGVAAIALDWLRIA